MLEGLPERIARVEEYIEMLTPMVREIRDDVRGLRKEMSFFKGSWSVITVLFAAAVAWVCSHFGGGKS